MKGGRNTEGYADPTATIAVGRVAKEEREQIECEAADKELQDSYGVMTPEELLYAMVDNAGEYQDFTMWMQKFQGFTKNLDDKVDEAKN